MTTEELAKAEEQVVKKGSFLYEGLVVGTVEIIETSERQEEDGQDLSNNLQDDQAGTCFQIRCTLSTDAINARLGQASHDSLSEAVSHVETCLEDVDWNS